MSSGKFDKGWIKIWRKIPDSILYHPVRLRVFMHVMTKAQYQTVEVEWFGHPITLGPGQMMLNERALSRKLRCSRDRIRRANRYLTEIGFFLTNTRPKGLLVTIRNWEKFQVAKEKAYQQPNQRLTNALPHNKEVQEEKKVYNPLRSAQPIASLKSKEDASADEAQKMFEGYWQLYPPRKGRKNEKGAARSYFLKKYAPGVFIGLKRAVENYSSWLKEANQDPKDFIRFLKDDYWKEWIDNVSTKPKFPRFNGEEGPPQFYDP